MAITSIPTRTDGSAGRTKTNSAPVTNLNTQLPSVEWNVVADAVCQVLAEVGLSNGSMPGTLVYISNNHEARIVALEAAIVTPPKNYAGVVVGIATSGDTINDCDYLDSGNGAQLQAALTANGGTKDILVRPGIIGLTGGPLNVPANTFMRFSGNTIVRPSATDRRAFVIGNNAKILYLNVEAQAPGVGATGTILVQVSDSVILETPSIQLTYPVTLGNMTNESLRYGIKDNGSARRVAIITPFMLMTTNEVVGLPQTLVGISLTNSDSLTAAVISPDIVRGDISIEAIGNVSINDCRIHSAKRRGIVASSASPNYSTVKIIGGTIKVNPDFEECVGIEVLTGADAGGLFNCHIHNIEIFADTFTLVTSPGISLAGTGTGALVSGCSIRYFPVGIQSTATQTHANITGNVVANATTFHNILGVSSNVSNNIQI